MENHLGRVDAFDYLRQTDAAEAHDSGILFWLQLLWPGASDRDEESLHEVHVSFYPFLIFSCIVTEEHRQ